MSADHDSQPGCAGSADLALQVIAHQQRADAIVQRVRAGELDADSLALELGKAYGVALRQLARALCKAIADPGA